MVHFETATLKFDGSCKPNPGEGGSGYVLEQTQNSQRILAGQYYVGSNATNNVAEYFGLIAGLKHLASSDHKIGHLEIEGDSELVINQLKGRYKVNSPRLKKLRQITLKTIERGKGRDFDSYSFRWIERRSNQIADGFANDARIEECCWEEDCYK